MNYQIYIKSELLILIPVLYLIGIGLKKSRLNDRYIPLTLGAVSVILSLVWVLATGEVGNSQEFAAAAFTALTQGVLLAGTSVYANQLYIQAHKHHLEDGSDTYSGEEITDFPQQDTFNCDDMTVSEDMNEKEVESNVFCDEDEQTGSRK